MQPSAPAPSSLDQFLREVGRRAVWMAQLTTHNREDALDVVQDSMLTLARKYANQPAAEWAPLFYTILQRRLIDWQRRRSVWSRWRVFLHNDDGNDEDTLEQLPAPADADPARALERTQDLDKVTAALKILPVRQQQAFLLRVWEGLDTAQTAQVMACSESSVKTHLARAMAMLRQQLEV